MIETEDSGGFTKMRNKLIDMMIPAGLSGRQWKIVMTIARYTYGYHKRTASISLKRLEQLTGVLRHNCISVIRSLVNLGIVAVGPDKSLSLVESEDAWSKIKPKNGGKRTIKFDTIKVDTINVDTIKVDSLPVSKSIGNAIKVDSFTPPVTPDLIAVSEVPKENLKKYKEIPAKNRREVKESSDAPKVNSWSVWVDAHRQVLGRDPVAIGMDLKASKTILAALKVDAAELMRIYVEYLQDKDPFIIKKGHALSFLPSQINKYTAKKYYSMWGGDEITKEQAEEEDKRYLKLVNEENNTPKPAKQDKKEDKDGSSDKDATVARLLTNRLITMDS